MSSLRMTFSLTSLIFLIALGLVFAPTSVMAHDDSITPDTNEAAHTHPLLVTVPADATATPPTTQVTTHGHHPMVTSIALKPATDKVRDDMVVVGAAPATPTEGVDANEFVLVITFDRPVVAAADDDDQDASDDDTINDTDAALIIAAAELTHSVRDKNRLPLTAQGGIAIAAATFVGTDYTKLEVLVTATGTAIPTGTAADDTEKVILRVLLPAGAAFSAQTMPDDPNSAGVLTVPGGQSSASTTYEFTLVKALPPAPTAPDTTAPVARITPPEMPESNGKLIFTIDLDEVLSEGYGALTASDFDVEGDTGTPVIAKVTVPTSPNAPDKIGENAVAVRYTLTVTPDTMGDTTVTVTLRDETAWDMAENPVASVSATYDKTAPTVKITAPDAPDTDGNLTFTFVFSEPIRDFGSNAIRGSGFSVVASVPMKMESTDTTTMTETWTVKVTPESATTAVTVAINAGAVTDKNGNGLAAGMTATYTPGVPAAPADFVATAGEAKVTLKWTVVAGATYQYRKKSGTATFKADGSDYMDIAAADLMAVTGSPTMMMYDVTGLTGGTEYTFEVRVKADGDVPAGTAAPAIATPTAAVTGGLADDDTRNNVTSETEFTLSRTLEPGEFVVIAPVNRSDIDGDEIVIAELPNIQRFFAKGGTISLIGGTSDAGTINKSVVITEIMWGLNTNAALGSQANHQWIELYNTDNQNADLKADTEGTDAKLGEYKLVFTPGSDLPKPANLADQVSNVDLVGWDVDIGQSGSLGPKTEAFSPVNMVSMYRDFKYADLTKVHNKDDAAKNRTAQLGVIPSGSVRGSWAASTISDTYANNQLGSPGAMHFVGRDTFDATNVGRNAVVITEVGNNSNDAYDWVELTAIANTNLENYELQHIYEKDKKPHVQVLAQFVKKELKAGEILLVVRSNPRNDPEHPIAAGKEWKVADADRDNTGTKSLYHVDSRLKIEDKGKGLFVLRSAKDKKNHENIVDLAGNYFYTDPGSAYRTNLWPLRATKAGHGNVIDGDVEDFNQNRVYQRNDRASGVGEKDWSVRGYTGIGYKRSAANSGANGGTPGFPNDALKEKDSDLAGDAAITISEIMYDRGDRNSLPQWIELHNSSMTQAVNLNEWKLKIENDSDVDVRTPRLTIANLGGTIIPPNQTVLIVAYETGRVSRGSQGRDDFPSARVINLSGKGELEIAEGVNKRNYRLLSQTAFRITLIEKGGATVDTVGNKGADPAWDLPMAEDGEGRSSVIRRYNTGKATGPGVVRGSGEGMAQDIWILAAKSDLAEVRVNQTYYGHPDDTGTPGYRGGGPLPVSLSKFRPERLKETGEIVVRWVTESELNNAGFNILRSEKRDTDFTKIHFEAGEGTTSERTVYEWKDTTAKPNVVYYYQIQDVSLDGDVTTLRTTHLRGNVTAAGKATTTWGEIKALRE